MVRAVIFDMDGTLADTEKYYSKFWRQAAMDFGFPMSFEESLELRSLTAPLAIKKTKQMFGENFDYAAIRQHRRELMRTWFETHEMERKPGVVEALQDLKQRGIKIAVATASNEERAERYLKAIGIRDYIEYLISATMVEIGKPFPDIYLYACEQIGEEPKDCIAVEDSPNGIRSAYEAGCKAVMVPDLTQPEEEIRPLLYAHLASLHEFPKFMDEETLKECRLCPRECAINRLHEKGACGVSADLKVARAALHMWEEPCISGEEGSGTVFFAGCPLHCIYCQNHAISDGKEGKEISVERLAEIFLELQEKGANNINLVTPTQYILQIRNALYLAKKNGLRLPIVYNSSGYEKPESLRLLDGLIDVYLPDFKYISPDLAKKYSHASDYAQIAKEALREMVRQVGTPEFDEKGHMKKGVIVRHLVLPEQLQDSKKVISYLYETYGDTIFISIMNQYTPTGKTKKYDELNRRLTESEYDEIVNYAISLGVENGFIQEGETAKESFIPNFDNEGV